jgi:hypothetical protein
MRLPRREATMFDPTGFILTAIRVQEWFDTLANELIVGLVVAVAMIGWIWLGREGEKPAPPGDDLHTGALTR